MNEPSPDTPDATLPRCTSCDALLAAVFPGMTDAGHQYDNVLEVTFHGGYGMFIDPFGEPDPHALLCHACAHRLCDTFPWAARLLRPDTSHSHQDRYLDALHAAGHPGVGRDAPPRTGGARRLLRRLLRRR